MDNRVKLRVTFDVEYEFTVDDEIPLQKQIDHVRAELSDNVNYEAHLLLDLENYEAEVVEHSIKTEVVT